MSGFRLFLALAGLVLTQTAHAQATDALLALDQKSCAETLALRSLRGDKRLEGLTFANGSDQVRVIVWLSYDGKPVIYAILAPGETYRVNTYETHPWVVLSPDGQCLQQHMPLADKETVSISS